MSNDIKNEKSNDNKASIVILTHNNIDYTKMCIESIRNYTEKGTYEIIVIDNNSSDNTVQWLKSQNDIKLICNDENVGFPKGCNQGIKVAEGESILFLNNDIIVTPNWLSNLNEALWSSNKVGAVGLLTNNSSYNQVLKAKYNNLEEMIKFATEYNKSDPLKWEERIRLVGFCMMVKKEVVDKIGYFDERFTPGNFEDDDYSYRILNLGYKLVLCKDTFVHHFGSASFKKEKEKFNNLLNINSKKFEEKWGFNSNYSSSIRYDVISQIKEDKDKEINVLELGCACGATLLKIKNDFKNANIYGIELNKSSASIAKNFADIRNDNIENINLSYEEGSFDYIILADVLEHLHNPEMVLKNIRKYLKNDGHVIASIPNVMHYTVIKNLINGYWTYTESGILDRTHIRFFTLNEINKMFLKCGYKNIQYSATSIRLNDTDKEFINYLDNFTNNNLRNQYEAYQYIIKTN